MGDADDIRARARSASAAERRQRDEREAAKEAGRKDFEQVFSRLDRVLASLPEVSGRYWRRRGWKKSDVIVFEGPQEYIWYEIRSGTGGFSTLIEIHHDSSKLGRFGAHGRYGARQYGLDSDGLAEFLKVELADWLRRDHSMIQARVRRELWTTIGVAAVICFLVFGFRWK